MSRPAYDALPAQYKEAVNIAAGWVNQWMMAAYDTRNPAAFKRMIGSGTRLQLFPNSFMIAAYRAGFSIYDAEAQINPAFKKIYEPWKRYRSEINEWHKTAEAAMTNFLVNWRADG